MAHRHVSARGEGTTAVLSPGDRERGSAFVTKGSRPLSRRYGGVDATETGSASRVLGRAAWPA
jgi:hypothetical protein